MSVIEILKATAASSNVPFTLVIVFCLAPFALVVGLVTVVVGGQVEHAKCLAARIIPFPTLQVLEIFTNLKGEYNPAALEKVLRILGDHKDIVLGPEIQRIEVPAGIYSLIFALFAVYAVLFVASTWAMSKLSGGNGEGGEGGGSTGGKRRDGKKERKWRQGGRYSGRKRGGRKE